MSLLCLLIGHKWRYQRCTRCTAWREMPAKMGLPELPNPRKVHKLKIWPTYAAAMVHGDKPWEVRKDDRDFRVGDLCMLYVWDPIAQAYGSMRIHAMITYILPGGQFGIQEGYVVMTMKVLHVTQDTADPTQQVQ